MSRRLGAGLAKISRDGSQKQSSVFPRCRTMRYSVVRLCNRVNSLLRWSIDLIAAGCDHLPNAFDASFRSQAADTVSPLTVIPRPYRNSSSAKARPRLVLKTRATSLASFSRLAPACSSGMLTSQSASQTVRNSRVSMSLALW